MQVSTASRQENGGSISPPVWASICPSDDGGDVCGCLSRVSTGPCTVWGQLRFISGNITQTSALCTENQRIHSMPWLILAGLPGLGLILELVCVLSISQVPRARTRVWRRAVWLPGKERQVNTQRSQEVLPTDHVCAGLLPQSFHLVSRNTHLLSFRKESPSQISSHRLKCFWAKVFITFINCIQHHRKSCNKTGLHAKWSSNNELGHSFILPWCFRGFGIFSIFSASNLI